MASEEETVNAIAKKIYDEAWARVDWTYERYPCLPRENKGRRPPVPTYQTLMLSWKDSKHG